MENDKVELLLGEGDRGAWRSVHPPVGSPYWVSEKTAFREEDPWLGLLTWEAQDKRGKRTGVAHQPCRCAAHAGWQGLPRITQLDHERKPVSPKARLSAPHPTAGRETRDFRRDLAAPATSRELQGSIPSQNGIPAWVYGSSSKRQAPSKVDCPLRISPDLLPRGQGWG